MALEIAEKRMKPGIYAKAFSDALGDKDRTLALYIKLRVENLRQEIAAAAQAEADAAAEAARAAAGDRRCECRHMESQHHSSKNLHETQGRYIAPCSACNCRDFKDWLDNAAV